MGVLGIVADGELCGIGRNAVVIVDAIGKTGIKNFGPALFSNEFLDVTIAVEKIIRSVARPVWSFEASRGEVDDASVGGFDLHGFERAEEHRLSCGRRK